MPFDSLSTKPSLRVLSDILRDRSQWPHGFSWNYHNVDNCAAGLAHRLWKQPWHAGSVSVSLAKWFDMPHKAAMAIFIYMLYDGCSRLVTPEHVADAIDAYLAK